MIRSLISIAVFRDDFVKLTKDEPIFLRFLKLVADQEQRPEAFKDFARR